MITTFRAKPKLSIKKNMKKNNYVLSQESIGAISMQRPRISFRATFSLRVSECVCVSMWEREDADVQ